jgi:hypothetical protein
MDFYIVTFSSSELKTVSDYLTSDLCPIQLPSDNYNPTVLYSFANDFLSWTDDKITNKDRILSSYTASELSSITSVTSPLILKLKPGVKFVIPQDKVNRYGIVNQGLQITSTDEATFKAFELAKLESDRGYNHADGPIPSSVSNGVTKQYYPNITIWVWCRALSENNPIPQTDGSFINNLKGQIFDLSPFIIRSQTSVGKNGGNFDITLPPLVCEFEKGSWVVKKNSIKSAISKVTGNNEYLSQESFSKINTSTHNLERNQFLFHNILSTNDLVFIRFETLNMESQQRYSDATNFFLNKNNLGGRIYDMIGLIDSNSFSYNPETNDVGIQVSGRDLSKLFIDDGSYFYALELSQGKANFAGGSQAKNVLTQRLFFDNVQMFQNLFYCNSIENVFKFVIQQISTIGVVPDDLFTSYVDTNSELTFSQVGTGFGGGPGLSTLHKKHDNDRRNYQYQPPTQSQSEKQQKQSIIDGYITKAKSELGRLRKLYGYQYMDTGQNVVNQDGEGAEINTIYNLLYDFLSFLRVPDNQKNISRQVTGNTTVGWKSVFYNSTNLQTNQFPTDFNVFPNQFTRPINGSTYFSSSVSQLISYIDNVIDSQKSSDFNEIPVEKLSTGIWQIIDLVIDSSVSSRRLVDSSISSSQGSLLNFFKKACQDPFVEYFSDTYSDKFILTIRRPPYNAEGVKTLLNGKIKTQSVSSVTGATITINEHNVLQESLSFDDTEVYSWYHLLPQAALSAGATQTATAYLPAIYLPEYAEIWGSRPYEAVSNYIPYLPLDNNNQKISTEIKQLYIDLAYLVESHAHLPFTRKGTLVLNGDRRIKRGNLIRYEATGEIFLVDAVSQSYMINEGKIDRTTTVQVSRGMIEQLIYGIDIQFSPTITKKVSYFNIINTDLNFNLTKPIVVTTPKTIDNPNYVPPQTEDSGTGDTLQQIFNPIVLGTNLGSQKILNSKILSGRSLGYIKNLAVSVQPIFTSFLLQAQQAGYTPDIQDGLRSYKAQLVAYNKNKSLYNFKVPSTNAPHVIGMALDVNFKNILTNITLHQLSPKSDWEISGIINIATSLGLRWGGTFSGGTDNNHFDYKGTNQGSSDQNGQPQQITQNTYSTQNVPDETKLLQNFKVDRDIFGFFLRKQQIQYANTEFINR